MASTLTTVGITNSRKFRGPLNRATISPSPRKNISSKVSTGPSPHTNIARASVPPEMTRAV